MVNYSAFHWSEKARKSAEEAKSIKETLGSIYQYKGSVNTIADLPENANIGDVYDVLDSGTNYAWTGDRWDSLGAAFDLSEYAKKEYVDSTEQEIIQNFMDADTALQTQITGLSGVLDSEQDKITAIEGKIPANASTSNMLSTASDLLNATQDVRSDFADADSELQTQINGQATVLSEIQDDVMANMGEIADIKTGKQDKLTAGENITINGNVISATSEVDGKITNCITEIPQDIKLELSNGTLTLKAGSKVYVPNGAGKFDEIVIANDLNVDVAQDSYQFMIAYNKTIGNIWFVALSNQASGTTPTGIGFYYNTSTNKMLFLRSGVADNYEFSLPLGIVTSDSNKYTSIDQVFNGFGYIGSTTFALPGVKGLAPNGRNEDGSLKNREFVISKVLTRNMVNDDNTVLLFTNPQYNAIYVPANTDVQYDEVNNIIKNTNTGEIYYSCILAEVRKKSGVITAFNPKTTFHALDYNDKSTIAGWGMPSNKYINLTVGATNTAYTAPANGYFCISKISTGNNKFVALINDKNIRSNVFVGNSGDYGYVFLPAKKGDIVFLVYNMSNTEFFRFYYAEGEQ